MHLIRGKKSTLILILHYDILEKIKSESKITEKLKWLLIFLGIKNYLLNMRAVENSIKASKILNTSNLKGLCAKETYF